MTQQQQQLINSNLDLLRIIAIQHRTPAWGVNDLAQEGYFGLARAAQEYREDKQVSFRSYASWWVHKYIREFLNAQHVATDNHVPVDELDVEDDSPEIRQHQRLLEQIEVAITELNERDRFIVNALYGIGGAPLKTYEVARMMQVSVQYVRRLRAMTQQKLKECIVQSSK